MTHKMPSGPEMAVSGRALCLGETHTIQVDCASYGHSFSGPIR